MKVIQVNDTYSLIGGSEKTLRKCSEQLVKLGHDVTIAHGEHLDSHQPDGPWRVAPIPALGTCTPLGDQSTCRNELAALIHMERPDIVHVRNFGGFGTLEHLAPLSPVVRTVHTIWGYCPNGMKCDGRQGGLCRKQFGWHCLLGHSPDACGLRQDGTAIPPVEWFTRLIACRMAVRADSSLSGIIVTSEYMKSELSRSGVPNDKITIIAPPIEITNRDENCRPPIGRRVLFVGRIVLWKGVRRLLEVLTHLPSDVNLDVAGDGPERPAMERYALDLGIADRVVFHGWVDHEQIGALYDTCAAVAFPTVAPEAFGNVGPEAMVHGRPVVAFDVGGIREWLVDGENGFVVPPGDITGFAEKLRVLLDDPNRAFEMGMAGRERTKRLFSAEEHARKTVEFYEECIERWKSSRRGGVRR